MKRALLMAIGTLLVMLWAGRASAGAKRFACADKIVKDKKTGLIWARSITLEKRDRNGAFELVNELNRSKYAGFNDWRLPSRAELETLITYAKELGYDGGSDIRRPYQLYSKIGFHNIMAGYYWSSSTYADRSNYSWFVDMNDGRSSFIDNTFCFYVWPVRSDR